MVLMTPSPTVHESEATVTGISDMTLKTEALRQGN
jgi:hypothetical protein